MQQFFQRPERRISRIIVSVFRPRLKEEMNVIGHHASRKQFITFVVKIPQRIQNDCAPSW